MRKLSSNTLDDPAPRSRSSSARAARFIVLGLALSPLIYESAILCAANWRGMTGADQPVVTPVLTRVAGGLETVAHVLSMSVSSLFQHLPWQPELVLGVAAAWAGGGAWLLRSHWR